MSVNTNARASRLSAAKQSLHAGVALSMGLLAAPLHSQTADGAAGSDLQTENVRLRRELDELRRQLASAQGAHPAAAHPPVAAPENLNNAAADAPAPATGVANADEDEVKVVGRIVGAALRDLKDNPKPVSVVTQAELKIFDQVTLPDVLSRLGNVRFNDGNPRTGSFSMRGLTAGAGTDTIDPSIGLTVDGVPYAYLAMAVGTDLVDIEQVNVTRGPQGTTGARHTSVGQINVTTRRPSFTPDASASLTLGSNNALRAEVEGGGPIIDGKLAFRITATRDQRDGDYWNKYPDLRGLQSHGNIDRTYGRVQLLFTPTEDFRVRVLYDHQPNGDEYVNGLAFNKPTPDFYANGAPVDKTNDVIAKLSRRWFTQQSAYTANDYYKYPVYLDSNRAITTGGKGGLVDASWDIGDQTLSVLSSARKHYFLAANDDGTPFDISRNGGFISTYWQFTNEAKLTGELGDGLVNYTAGLFYLKAHTNSLNRSRQGNDSGAYNANVAEYAALDANSSGRELLTNSLARVYRGDQSYVRSESKSAFAQADWHLTHTLTLTTGGRISREARRLSESISILDNGYGSSLNPVNVGAVQLGGFNSTAFTAANAGTLVAGQSAAQLSLADAVAQQYFNVAATGTPGGAYNSLTAAQRRQVAAAKAIRLRTFSTLFSETAAKPWIGNIYTGQLSVRNDFSQNLTSYATVQYGEKPGIAQFNGLVPGTSGAPRNLPAKKERTISYEVGVRTNWLGGDLVLNANVFRSYIKDFQQTVYFLDDLLTALNNDGTLYYSSGVGNVGKVRTQGLETDLVYSGLRYTTFRFSGAYTDAKYLDFAFSGQPSENANLTQRFRDVSGFTLPNAPKLQFNVTGDYRRPIFENYLFHTSAGYTYTSRENGDTALSAYGFRKPYGIADASIGFGRRDGLFDVNLVVRNLFDEDRGDPGWNTYTVYQRRRWIGAVVSSKFR
ncbi:TonB-dependent receptor [Sphingomonas sp. AP4-R1]|uniref:TonB-dependent receptor n=1 Tax=Sphingomonas sp. AP4-R1 TaxID=2735134 RepID=UPI0014934B99|nr:TonB-dependent receptor [Sphingomonas sp. AP4-R1]QJU58347.1 TonB-dependent receptor [Sphingomonas sp. AP4-R1]